MKFTKRSQQGFALILVLLIGALMMIPVLMLLSAVAPRRATVTGEAVSDIALASADGVVDKIATKINTFPTLLSTDPNISSGLENLSTGTDMDRAQFAIGYLLSTLNGANSDLAAIQKAVSTYLFDSMTGKYYAVWGTSQIASVSDVGSTTGDAIGRSTPIRDLSTDTTKVPSAGIWGIDGNWSTDNRWIEIDTNTQFSNAGTSGVGPNTDTTSRFIIRATAYPLSGNKDISGRMRTVQAEVSLGHVKVVPGAFVDSLWSGGNLEINSGGTMTGNVYSAGSLTFDSGGTINGDVQAGGALLLNSGPVITGNVYAGGSISVPSGCTIGGNIQTGGSVTFNTASSSTVGGYIHATNSITTNSGINLSGVQSSTHSLGGKNVVMSTGVVYAPPAVPTPRPFIVAAALSAGASTANTAAGSAGISTYSTSSTTPITVGASGSHLPYYVSGNVGTNDITLNFAPIADKTVAWYVGGDVNISGTATLNFTSPCTIFVGGTFHSNDVIIKGTGTIVANMVDVNGVMSRPASDTDSNITMIMGTPGVTTFSNPVNIPAIIYAPNGSVTLSSGGTINAGYIVAKGDVNAPSRTNIALPFPGAGSDISFITNSDSSTAFKRSWKELISAKYTVTPPNFTNGNFPTVYVNGDFSQ